MGKYRKKPVEIVAYRLEKDMGQRDLYNLAHWCGGMITHPVGIRIPTLEGDMIALPGDYIIKGVKGEFYPCKPDIFEATYEEV